MKTIGNSSINDLLKNQNDLDDLSLKISNVSSTFTSFENIFTNINKSFGLFSSHVNEISQSLTDINKSTLTADSSFTKLGKTFSALSSISNEKPKLDSISRSFYNILMQDANAPKWRVPDDIRNQINKSQSPLKDGNLGPFLIDQGIGMSDELITHVHPRWSFLYNLGKWGAKTGNIAANSDSGEDLVSGLGQLGVEWSVDKLYAFLASKYGWGPSVGPGLLISMATTFDGHGEENKRLKEIYDRQQKEEEEERRKLAASDFESLTYSRGLPAIISDQPESYERTVLNYLRKRKDVSNGSTLSKTLGKIDDNISDEDLRKILEPILKNYFEDKSGNAWYYMNTETSKMSGSGSGQKGNDEEQNFYSSFGNSANSNFNKQFTGLSNLQKSSNPFEIFQKSFGEARKLSGALSDIMKTLKIGTDTFVGKVINGFGTAVSIVDTIINMAQSSGILGDVLGAVFKGALGFLAGGPAGAAVAVGTSVAGGLSGGGGGTVGGSIRGGAGFSGGSVLNSIEGKFSNGGAYNYGMAPAIPKPSRVIERPYVASMETNGDKIRVMLKEVDYKRSFLNSKV